MDKRRLLLAIDLGTSRVKVGVFDAEGWLVTKAAANYPTRSPQPGWVEQSPEEWWTACCQAIKEVATQIDPAQIQGMCVAGQSPALICLNKRGAEVRPASIWSD